MYGPEVSAIINGAEQGLTHRETANMSGMSYYKVKKNQKNLELNLFVQGEKQMNSDLEKIISRTKRLLKIMIMKATNSSRSNLKMELEELSAMMEMISRNLEKSKK